MLLISYTREDRHAVVQLEHELSEAGIPVLTDVPLSESNPYWRNEILRLMSEASALLVYWSGDAARSPWVDEEIRAFAGRRIWFRNGKAALHAGRCCDRAVEDWQSLLRELQSLRTAHARNPERTDTAWRRKSVLEQAEGTFRRFRTRRRPDVELIREGERILRHSREDLYFGEVCPGVWISHTSVSEAQFRRFLDESGYPGSRYAPGPDASEARPVTSVSWYEAQACCEWMGGSLPGEEEWQRAAATSLGLRYATATGGLSPREARYEGRFAEGEASPQTMYPPNPDGYFGMSGNTWDWCRTAWGGHRVIRGGSWMDSRAFCTTEARYRNAPVDRDCTVGFRVRIGARPKGGNCYEVIRVS